MTGVDMNAHSRTRAQSLPAVVVGLDCITGLQATRILARHGVPVIGVAENARHFACWTRRCEQKVIASTRTEQLIDVLEQVGQQHLERPVLLPCTDTSVLLISQFRERLTKYFRIALPSAEVVEMMLDKKAFCEFALAHDLPIPRTFFLHSWADAERASRQIRFPCILKPPLKTPRWEQATKIKAFKVESAADLLELYDRSSEWADVLMLQEWIDGSDADLYSCNCYFDQHGQSQAVFTARKLRQWPPHTGTSCLGEECQNDELREVALRLFHTVDFRGLGYLEMKQDCRSGRQLIIEPNIGRPTGRSAIAEAGGVELLYTMYCDLAGRGLPEDRQQSYRGAKWIYWRQDLRSALHYWKRGELSLAEWLRSLSGKKATAVFSWSDPLPFAADWLGTVGKLFRRRDLSPRDPRHVPGDVSTAAISAAAAGEGDGSAVDAAPAADHPTPLEVRSGG